MAGNIIEIQGLEKIYHKDGAAIIALKIPQLSLGEGKVVSLGGHSGAGKTTLLALLGALDRADKGRIVIDGADIAALAESERAALRGQKIGFVFQSANLIPTLNLEENIILPLIVPSRARAQKDKILFARELMRKAGLEKRKRHFPSELSGGERQRAAVIRALACQPQIILADEPTANLDNENAYLISGLLLGAVPDLRLLVIAANDNRILFPEGALNLTLSNGSLV